MLIAFLFLLCLGLILGYYIGDPYGIWLGPLIVFILFGLYVLYSAKKNQKRDKKREEKGCDYTQIANRESLVLFALVMGVDGRILRTELDAVKNAIHIALHDEKRELEALKTLRDILAGEPSVSDIKRIYWDTIDPSFRSWLFGYLLEVAQVDGALSKDERKLLDIIANKLSIPSYEYTRLQKDKPAGADNYRVLGVTRSATNEEIRAAYRTLALKHHPDRLAGKSQAQIEKANEKMKRINAAYEAIKKARGMR